jgi:calcineurin-like phosphoesterase family protein
MSIFFTADHHFGHENIIKHCNRPWRSAAEMDAALVDAWNAVVTDDDTVYILGDLTCQFTPEPDLTAVSLLNGFAKILVPGNHDHCWTGHKAHEKTKKAETYSKILSLYADAGVEVAHDVRRLSYPLEADISHFPYSDDEEARFREYRPVDRGRVLLHGHVHTAWDVTKNMVNVGVDTSRNYAPLSLDEVQFRMLRARNL